MILSLIAAASISLALPPPPPPRTQAVNITVLAVASNTLGAGTIQSPYPPEDLHVVVTNNRPISVSWDFVPGALSYELRWNTNGPWGEYRWSTNTGTQLAWTFFALPVPPAVPYYRYYYVQSSPWADGPYFDVSTNAFLKQTNAGPFDKEFYRVRVLQTTNASLP